MKDLPIRFLIPFRSGSKGLKDKNLAIIKNIPLYAHSIDQAVETGLGDVFVSTNYKKDMLKLEKQIKFIKRKESLSADKTEMKDVVNDFIKNIIDEESIIVLLQVTTPLRKVEDIKEALNLFQTKDYDLVMSVTKHKREVLKYGFMDIENSNFRPINKIEYCFKNRQELPHIFKPNGAIYIFNSEWFRINQSFVTNNIGAHIMDDISSIDIDSMSDLEKVRDILNEN